MPMLESIWEYGDRQPACQRPKHAESVVYALKSGDLIKFGHTKNLKGRIKSISKGCPDPVEFIGCVSGDHSLEGAIHDALGDYRIEGEWFAASDSVRAMANAIASSDSFDDVRNYVQGTLESYE